MNLFNRKPKENAARWPLDLPIIQLGDQSWTLSDAVTGLAVIGEPGSGKSSGPARTFAHKFLINGMGGLVLCFKRDEAATWVKYMEEAGRAADVRLFNHESAYRFNFLDFESKTHTGGLDHIDNLVNLLMDIVAVRRTAPIGNDATFWEPQKRMLVRNCLSLLIMAGEPLTLRSLNNLMQSSPNSLDEANSKEWKNHSYLWRMLEQAHSKNGDHDQFTNLDNFWLYIRPKMDTETRATIDAEFLGMIDGPLSRGSLADLFGTTTNIDPSHCFEGRVIIVDIPVEDYDAAGQYAALIWSTAFMRATKRRKFQPPYSRPVFFFADEAHAFSNEYDADYQATCRSQGVCCVRLTQNIPNFIRSYGGGAMAELISDAIFATLCTKVLLRNSDPTTNAWASRLIAKDTFYRPSLSNSASAGAASLNTSLSPVEEPSCPEKEFLGLKSGGPANKQIVEAIIFESGRKFNGNRWFVGTFRQKR